MNLEIEEEVSMEKLFENLEVPSWEKQLTMRAFIVSVWVSFILSFIVINLSLTIGVIPSLNVSAGLLGYFFVKTWINVSNNSGVLNHPFTRQENTVIQTCVVASTSIAFSGGFGSYLFGMSDRIARQSIESRDNLEYKNPALRWMIPFLFMVSFLGLFLVVPLRKIMIIDYKLTYPSGTATAHLINSFHTPEGPKLAKKQVKELGKFFYFSFLWGFFQWFFTAGDNCGFSNFPTFGLGAYKHKFYFDFSATYIGVGMICPYMVNISMLIGGILSWGIMWPLIATKEGDWYPKDISETSLSGLQGYKVFISTALILGDGLYNFFKVLLRTLASLFNVLYSRRRHNNDLPVMENHQSSTTTSPSTYDTQRRTQFFLKDQIPTWFAITGYVVVAAISSGLLPLIFPDLKWYYIISICVVAPTLAFCNAFGCGLTDWSLPSTYGKLGIFVIGTWAGPNNGGILAGLAACGVLMNIVSAASDLMQDFKTGYLTLASPRAMFVSQVIGTSMGCVISPCVFWLFYEAFPDLGLPGTEYPAPYALVYHNIAKLGVEGTSSLPKNCLMLCYIFFGAAIVLNSVRDGLGKERAWFIPLPMVMAIPLYLGSYFAIDMCIGSLILFVWERRNKAKADAFGPAVASGLICGDGMWTLPSCILTLAGVKPPICMKFVSRGNKH